MALEVTYRRPSELHPDPGNARTHPKSQVEEIAASIRTFGFSNPILVDEKHTIIAGHGRLLAAKALGLQSVPTITLHGLSEAGKRALRLADNRIALKSGWDADLLRVELEALSGMDLEFDLEVTGFSLAEIDLAIATRPGKEGDVQACARPSIPVSEPGDIWQLGSHRVGSGDCRDNKLLARVMQGTTAAAAFLDPPYNVAISGFAVARGTHAEFAMASGEMTPAQFTEFLTQALSSCAAVSKDGAVHFCAMDWRHLMEILSAGREVYGDLLNLCVWNKSNGGMGTLYRSKHELIFVFKVGTAAAYNAVELGKNGRNRTNVWDYASVNTLDPTRRGELALHPTVKPSQMVADALMDVSKRGDVVLDTFLGSGTTLIAAERIGRVFRGTELDPGYVDVAIDRWTRLTGSEGVLADTGETFSEVRERRHPEII